MIPSFRFSSVASFIFAFRTDLSVPISSSSYFIYHLIKASTTTLIYKYTIIHNNLHIVLYQACVFFIHELIFTLSKLCSLVHSKTLHLKLHKSSNILIYEFIVVFELCFNVSMTYKSLQATRSVHLLTLC